MTAERVCAIPGCTTILSLYNPTDRCGVHELTDPGAKSLGDLLRRSRMDLGLTQVEVSELIGIGQSSVSSWERGDSFPAVSRLASLCDLLGIDAYEMLRAAAPGRGPAFDALVTDLHGASVPTV